MPESAAHEPFSLFNQRAILNDGGTVSTLDADENPMDGWVIGVEHVTESWAGWRRNEDGDAFLFLLWGAADVMMADDPAGDSSGAALKAASAFIIPKGAWHRVMVEEPANLLTATRAGRQAGQ